MRPGAESAADIATPAPTGGYAAAYRHLYEYAAIDGAFLWRIRSRAVEAPNYTAVDLAKLERRLAAHLNFLMTVPDLGWATCAAALERGGPGEVFVTAVIALSGRDPSKIEKAVQTGLANPHHMPAVVSALGWLPADIVMPWIERLLRGKDMNHKHLGIAACSVRRADPGNVLNEILDRDDCRAHPPLHARALRLAGELRRHDATTALRAAQVSDDPGARFWASWSLVVLGHRHAAGDLKPYVFAPGPYRSRALALVFRALPINTAREWIAALVHEPIHLRRAIAATGTLGDPQAAPWLIDRMTDPLLARLAGEAFTAITGLDLAAARLTATPRLSPEDTADDPADPQSGIEQDEDLPWPDADGVATWWRRHGAQFTSGHRYILGRAATTDWLAHVLAVGTQRQRRAAALELALIDPRGPLRNTRARVIP